MANKFATENFKTLALNVLPILKNRLKLPALVDNQYDATRVNAQEGSTISVKRPVVFGAKQFVSQIELQTISRKLVDIKLDTLTDVSFELTVQEMTFIINNDAKKSKELLAPAFAALSDDADARIVSLFGDIPFHTGNPSKSFDSVAPVLAARKTLVDRHVPANDRRLVLSSAAYAELLAIDAFRDLSQVGSTDALKEASLGKKFQFEMYESDQDLTHIVGEAVTLAAADITLSKDSVATLSADNNDIVNKEFNTFSLAGLGAGKVNKGELLSVTQAGKEYQFVVKEEADAAAGAADVKVFPVYRDAAGAAIVFASTSVVTVAGKAEGSYEKSTAFQKQAFAFVPVALPDLSVIGIKQAVVSADGISFRITMDYDIKTKKATFSVDMLTGYATLYPELATVVIGG